MPIIKTSLVCLLLLLYMGVFYFSNKHLPIKSSKIFNAYYFIIDVNNLKETNDFLGHFAGDELLQAVSHLLRDAASENGFVFRQGGDEFAILWNQDNPSIILYYSYT